MSMTARQLTIFDLPIPVETSPTPSQKVASIPTPPKSGRQLRDEAIERVENGPSAEWVDRAYRVLMTLCLTAYEVTSDDLWFALGDDRPPEPRAMGPVFRRALIAGVIERTDRMKPSTRPDCHCRPIAIWMVS